VGVTLGGRGVSLGGIAVGGSVGTSLGPGNAVGGTGEGLAGG